MNSAAIAKEMELAFLCCRAGLIPADRAVQEVAMLQALLRACDQAELERKLEVLEAALEARGAATGRGGGHV